MKAFCDPGGWDDDDEPLLSPLDALEVEVAENPITGRLFDPTGVVLLELRERHTVPFGFRGSR